MSPHDLARLRQGVYRLTSAGFAPPDPEVVELAAGSITVLTDLGLFDFAFSLPLIDYAAALSKSEVPSLATAYMALFEVGVGGAACPPAESAWVANPHAGEAAVIQSELRRTYLRFGLEPRVPDSHSPDHVSVELGVMASLCAAEADRLDTDRSIHRVRRHQREFQYRHLNRWMPRFTAAVIEADRHRVYSALARATHAFLTHDTELLTIMSRQAEQPVL